MAHDGPVGKGAWGEPVEARVGRGLILDGTVVKVRLDRKATAISLLIAVDRREIRTPLKG